MRKMITRWVMLAVFLIALALVCVRLGQWQLDRLEQRRDRNDVMVAQEHQPVVDYLEVMGGSITETDQWQRVKLSGTYTGQQYQIRYRNLDGSPGIEVAAPLRTTEGKTVIIDRGFIARTPGQPDITDLPDPPEGQVTVTGYLRMSETGPEEATTPHEFQARLINSQRIAADLGLDVLDGYVALIESSPNNGDQLQPITPPEPGEGNHFSYALQWFTFGVIAIVGIVVLIRADLKDLRKAKQRRATRESAREQ